jgi:hypothetical protein
VAPRRLTIPQSYSSMSHFCAIGGGYFRHISRVFGHGRLGVGWIIETSRLLNLNAGDTANCWELAVPIFLLTKVFAAGSLAAAGSCCLLEVAMILASRRSLRGWEQAQFQRNIAITFRSHRRFYPGSRLRAAFVASSLLLGCCIAGLIVIHRFAQGM